MSHIAKIQKKMTTFISTRFYQQIPRTCVTVLKSLFLQASTFGNDVILPSCGRPQTLQEHVEIHKHALKEQVTFLYFDILCFCGSLSFPLSSSPIPTSSSSLSLSNKYFLR